MPASLSENQHEISTLDGSRALVFGTEDTGYLTLSRPTYGGGDMRTGDQERPQEDGVMPGRDYRAPKAATFELGILTDALTGLDNGDPHRANLDALNTLEDWWADERLRNRPRAMAVLRTCEAGRTYRCYGRPRGYEESAGSLTKRGYTPVVCGFELFDDRWYADDADEVEASLAPTVEGGFTFPLISVGAESFDDDPPPSFLFSTIVESTGQTIAHVTGRSTWPWVTFEGPVLNPSVSIGGLYIGLLTSIAAGQSVTVDTRPWQRTVLRSDGANLAGRLDPTTPALRDCLLYAGDHDVIYRGKDATGSSRATVNWRQARNRP